MLINTEGSIMLMAVPQCLLLPVNNTHETVAAQRTRHGAALPHHHKRQLRFNLSMY